MIVLEAFVTDWLRSELMLLRVLLALFFFLFFFFLLLEGVRRVGEFEIMEFGEGDAVGGSTRRHTKFFRSVERARMRFLLTVTRRRNEDTLSLQI